MAYSIVKCDNAALNDVTWLRDARSSFDVAAALTSALTPFWTIEREVDPSGELTIIVLPVGDTEARPTFILCARSGVDIRLRRLAHPAVVPDVSACR